MTEQTQPTDAEILDAADDFRSQYKHGGTTFDEVDALNFARAVLAKWGTQPAPADSVLEDAERLDWLLLRISGAEFRRVGVHYSGNARRADVDAARKQGESND